MQEEKAEDKVERIVFDESSETPEKNDESASQPVTQAKSCKLDLSKSYLTDRGHLCEDVLVVDLKTLILQHGPSQPGGIFPAGSVSWSNVYNVSSKKL